MAKVHKTGIRSGEDRWSNTIWYQLQIDEQYFIKYSIIRHDLSLDDCFIVGGSDPTYLVTATTRGPRGKLLHSEAKTIADFVDALRERIPIPPPLTKLTQIAQQRKSQAEGQPRTNA